MELDRGEDAQAWRAPGSSGVLPEGNVPKQGGEVGSWQVTQDSRAVRRERDSPSVSLPALVAAPPHPSSSPAAPPAQSGAAGAGQDPWTQHPSAPAVLPAGKDRKTHKTGWKKLLKGDWGEPTALRVPKKSLIHAEIMMKAQHSVSRAGHSQRGCWPRAKRWKNSQYNNKYTKFQKVYTDTSWII